MISRTAAAAALLSATLLAGCGDSDPVASPGPSASPSPVTSSATPSTPATEGALQPSAPAFPANTLPDTEQANGGPLGVRSARADVHPGYDRVVIELGGTVTGQPGWTVEYVTTPTSDGSGEPVAVQGSAFLQVIVRATGYPGDTGVPEPSTRRITPTGTKLVREVVLDGGYEGQYTAFVGLSAKKPFRVFRLSGPPRVVIDIRHA